MTRGKPQNVGASVRARLMNRSRETGDDFQFLLERYASRAIPLPPWYESQYRDRIMYPEGG